MDTDLKPLLALYGILFICCSHLTIAILWGVVNNLGLMMYPFIALNASPYILYLWVTRYKEEMIMLADLMAECREYRTRENTLASLIASFSTSVAQDHDRPGKDPQE
jgi:hypothetical protein